MPAKSIVFNICLIRALSGKYAGKEPCFQYLPYSSTFGQKCRQRALFSIFALFEHFRAKMPAKSLVFNICLIRALSGKNAGKEPCFQYLPYSSTFRQKCRQRALFSIFALFEHFRAKMPAKSLVFNICLIRALSGKNAGKEPCFQYLPYSSTFRQKCRQRALFSIFALFEHFRAKMPAKSLVFNICLIRALSGDNAGKEPCFQYLPYSSTFGQKCRQRALFSIFALFEHFRATMPAKSLVFNICLIRALSGKNAGKEPCFQYLPYSSTFGQKCRQRALFSIFALFEHFRATMPAKSLVFNICLIRALSGKNAGKEPCFQYLPYSSTFGQKCRQRDLFSIFALFEHCRARVPSKNIVFNICLIRALSGKNAGKEPWFQSLPYSSTFGQKCRQRALFSIFALFEHFRAKMPAKNLVFNICLIRPLSGKNAGKEPYSEIRMRAYECSDTAKSELPYWDLVFFTPPLH